VGKTLNGVDFDPTSVCEFFY